jgi:hypothetical protein
MNPSVPLRKLSPGPAWNEAMRRSFVASIGGFFLPNLLANFGAIPQLHPSFQFMPGVCGAAGAFFASMALYLGYFHKKWIQGITAAIVAVFLPYAASWFWFRITQPSASTGFSKLVGPTVVTSIVTYFAFMFWHARSSNSTFDGLSEQMVADDYGQPKHKWERVVYGVCLVIGSVVLLLLFLSSR